MRSPPSSSALSAERSWQQRYSQKNRSVAECLTVCVVVRRECNCCKLCTSGVWEDEKGERERHKQSGLRPLDLEILYTPSLLLLPVS